MRRNDLLETPLYEQHVRASARLVDFAGWSMPVQYESIIKEHRAVRSAAGLFDLSHMGRLVVAGTDATAALQWLTVNDVAKLTPGKAHYSMFCNESGGILDDVVVYRTGGNVALPSDQAGTDEESYLVVVNASNREKIVAWSEQQIKGRSFKVDLSDRTFELAMIGLQGPGSQQVLQPYVEADLDRLAYYHGVRARCCGVEAFVSRTGYTGEDGFEVILRSEDAEAVWRCLKGAAAVHLCGLGARDTLRMEAGMPLYGHELTEETNPLQAGLARVVKLDKGDFVGRSALSAARERPVSPKLVGFRMVESGVPRHGYPVTVAGEEVGRVTSGGFGPTIDANIGMAYVQAEYADDGQDLWIAIRDRAVRAAVVPIPFYRRPKQI